ncbi:MAG: tetratricopeptide repeat protein [Proteobacteria bacterium]|nr:tetratricopeptide repeat protein [Pseudomonadota bacterium]
MEKHRIQKRILSIAPKKAIAVSLVLSLILIGISTWWGGRERWEMAGLGPGLSATPSISKEYESRLEEQPDSIHLKYNLAYFYYRQGKFAEARELLKEVLDSAEGGNEFVKKTFYNLGNDFFRLAEEEGDPSQAIALLGESLEYYRAVIEKEKQEEKYSALDLRKDEDAHFNYAVVRRRIKILADQLEKRKKEQEQQKNLYTLIKELVSQEEEIKNRLLSMQEEPDSKKTVEKRNDLMKLRVENLRKLRLILEKIRQTLGASQPQLPSASPRKPSPI